MSQQPIRSLQDFLKLLDREGELHRITVPIDPNLEAAEIAVRVMRNGGKALLFENIIGSKYPVAMNILSSDRRVELSLGTSPDELGHKLISAAEMLMPPKPQGIYQSVRSLGSRLLASRITSVSDHRSSIAPKLSELPILKTWPDDGGKFITLPEVFTYDPRNGKRNVGMYRIHHYDDVTTGIHWQIQKGGGFHYHEAERMNRPLEVAIAVGTDPPMLLATVSPLPENIDEALFAGFLRGESTRMTKGKTLQIAVPAEAEFILEGIVPPNERRLEGPFGDHFGHYSHAGMFPVFHLKAITTRPDPIFAATVVGKPPMEDKWLGDATQKILGPLAKLTHPEVKDIWAFYEAGFHNLIGVSTNQRYAKEAMKTALSLVSDNQLSLTKCAIIVDDTVNNRDFRSLLRQIREHFDPHYDLLIIPKVAMDTLDFTSYTMNLGSKMLIDATRKPTQSASGGSYPVRMPNEAVMKTGTEVKNLRDVDSRIIDYRSYEDALLVVKVKGAFSATENAAKHLENDLPAPKETNGSEVLKKLIAADFTKHLPNDTKIIAAVSEDVDLSNDMEVIWGIFTRFDAARDVFFTSSKLERSVVINEGIVGIDATWKPGYPNPCVMSEEVIDKVDRRWKEYGF
jgi:UbiD family decarboxylase